MQLRTRSSLLHSLCEELKDKTREFLGSENDSAPDTPKSESGPGSRFIDTVRKALIARVRNQSVANENNNNNNNNPKKTPMGSVPETPTPVVSFTDNWIL